MADRAPRILLVDDEQPIQTLLSFPLQRDGYEVVQASDGREALARFSEQQFDLVVLDLMLPRIDGLEVCKRLRAGGSTVPIIMLTAKSEEIDKVLGLELGADDYVVKPFGFRELVARIRAVIRRARAAPRSVEGPQRLGPLELDRRQRRVLVGGTEIVLTAKEFDLLALLAEDPGAVFARDQILERVWDPHWFGPTKTLDVHVASLRRKLGDPGWIETVRGVGFRLVVR
jgi:DNA-binding response OmpR family regulator